MAAKTLILNGLAQSNLDMNNFQILNLDTSNLPPSGIPPTITPPTSNWLRTWNSNTLTWTYAQPNFTDISGVLTTTQQQNIVSLGTVRVGIWQASQINQLYLPVLNNINPPTGNLSLNNFRITNLADPIDLQDAVTRNFMDNLLLGLNPHQAVRLATTSLVTHSGLTPIDGVTPVVGDRILVKDQGTTRANENGIYIAASGSWSFASDWSSSDDMNRAYCYVLQGTQNGGTSWYQVDAVSVPATDPKMWLLFSNVSNVTAGAGLNKVGNTLNVLGTTNRITVGDTVDIASNYIGQNTITTLGTITTGTWNATLLDPFFGGTGRSNAFPITLGVSLSVQLAALAIGSSLEIDVVGDTIVQLPETGILATISNTETFSNKRITQRVSSVSSSATPAINTDNVDVFKITALAVNITSMTSSLTGTPNDGDGLAIWFKDTGTSRTISWGTSWTASTDLALPTATTSGKWLFTRFVWSAQILKWVLLSKLDNI